jgi:hypothetical protein
VLALAVLSRTGHQAAIQKRVRQTTQVLSKPTGSWFIPSIY